MPIAHFFDPPDRFVVGTVGQPGSRRFYLQARGEGRVISVACEKQQVQILAERINGMLDELQAGGHPDVPSLTPVAWLDSAPLESPVEEQFVAGSMTLSWDGETDRVAIEIFPVEYDDDEDGYDEVMYVRLPVAQARAFANRAVTVVSAGRPPCQFCGEPIDPDGHLCPRANGFRRTPR